MKAGRISHIEGNRDHPVNRGVLCAKGASGLMQHLSPARLRAPLRRVGPRGSGQFEEIGWDEALETARSWMAPLRETAPEKLAFFTGRDQSQSFTSWWAQAFGTPNYAAHGGFCSVNMAAAGISTIGAAFWEFGQPDWDRAELMLLFGVAEDHDSNPIKMGLGTLKTRGAQVVGVNPVRTGYNAIADDWIGITPGTDGLFVLSLVHCLLEAGKIDLDYLARFTDAPCLVDARGGAGSGLLLRGPAGKALVVDRRTGRPVAFDAEGAEPSLTAGLEIDGVTHRTVMAHMVETYLARAWAPETTEARTGVTAATVRALAARLAETAFGAADEARAWTDFRGVRHETTPVRPVAVHAMRGISAHSNGFQTCRAIHLLQVLLGAVERPGSFRMKPPYPKPMTAHPKPHGRAVPGQPLDGPHLGFPQGPDDLLIDDDGRPLRIDGAFSWDAPLSAHGMMHLVISNAHAGVPYGIDTLFLYMANMAWNSSMGTERVIGMLTDRDDAGDYVIPRIVVADAYSSEMVAYADLVLPDTTYLERHDCISLLDRPISEADAAADAIRWPVVAPDRDVRGFQSVLLDLGHRLGLPGMVAEDGGPKFADYADYIQRHERRPGVGPLAGWRAENAHGGGARGTAPDDQIDRYIASGGFWHAEVPEEARFMKPWNRAYQDWAVGMGFYDAPQPYLITLWSEPLRRFQLAAEGWGRRQPPERLRQRISETFAPLPTWYPPFGDAEAADYPLHALTQRPAAMYHSWGGQNAWLRQIHGENPLYVPDAVWAAEGFEDGDWAEVTSPHGRIVVPAARMAAVNGRTVWTWNAIGKRAGAWALDPDAPEATKGFLLNHLIHELLPPKGDGHRWANADPITGQAAWFDLRVRIRPVPAPSGGRTLPDTGRGMSPVGRGPDVVRAPGYPEK